jgi:hypothetical protein
MISPILMQNRELSPVFRPGIILFKIVKNSSLNGVAWIAKILW